MSALPTHQTEQKASETLALEYLQTDPAGRGQDTPIIRIKQGYEPPNFTGFFGVWDNDLWNVSHQFTLDYLDLFVIKV